MNETVVEKLLASFDELDRCIEITRKVLSTKEGVPEDVLLRVSQYPAIVQKQRNLTRELKDKLTSEDWEEVTRLVKVINGLSAMIRDDAQQILSGAYSLSREKPNLCELS